MAEKGKKEGKGVPAVLLIGGAAAAAAAALYFATRAKAAPPPPPEGYVCPYCGATFATYEELVAHVQQYHPGERIPIEITWQ